MRLTKLLYSKTETAEVLGIAESTVNRDIYLGRIAAKKYGKRVLVPASELERIAESLPNVAVAGAR